MGIGRREFLVQFGGVVAVLASANRVAAAVEDLYVNRKHGLAFRKPPGWTFDDVQEITAGLEGMVLDFPGFDGDQWAEYIRADELHGALVVCSDHSVARPIEGWRGPTPETYLPIFTLAYEGDLASRADADESPKTLMEFVNVDLPLTARIYKDFRVLKGPDTRSVSGCEAVEYTSEHLFKHKHMPKAVRVRERALYIHQNPAIYSFRMADYPSFSPPLVHDFDEFIEGIRVL